MSQAGASVETFVDTQRKQDVRLSNMTAAKAVADAVRTSLGPRCVSGRCSGGPGLVVGRHSSPVG